MTVDAGSGRAVDGNPGGTVDRDPGTAHNLILTGPPGAGKSSAGRALAGRLGWTFTDLDESIEAVAGLSVPEIFAREGEAGFRTCEREAVRALVASTPRHRVIATGGWTCGDPDSRAALETLGPVVCLTASADTLSSRLAAPAASARPLLGPADPWQVEHLLILRQAVYDSFPLQVDTDSRDISTVLDHVLHLLAIDDSNTRVAAPPPPAVLGEGAGGRGPAHTIPVRAPVDRAGPRGPRPGYSILVGPAQLDRLGLHLAARGITGRAVVVTDAQVGPLYTERVLASLRSAGIQATAVEIPVGETTKSLSTVAELYAAFLAARLDRDGVVIALGGGVVGDTAGFAAATWLRGVALVMVPTSLLAMVDAAIGGKTGVNLAAGKNLAGAFKQPVLVVADPAVLATLPPEVLREGLAEVVKAAVIADPELFTRLEREGAPSGDEATVWMEIVARSACVKAAIVSEDPGEHGRRILLNLGHTFAHALEQTADYTLPHGQAVAIGLVAAARLARQRGIATDEGLADRIEGLLARLGLPVRWSGPSVADLVAAMGVDKKRRDGRLRFVLPIALGDVRVLDEVSEADVAEVLRDLRS
jgi:shikimate kinase/3-dehydroquinate synthase